MGKENEKRCFVIMPISDKEGYAPGHFRKVYEQIFIPAIRKAGFEPYRVDDEKLSQSIIKKIFDGLTKYDMALCDLSSNNPNVMYELGIRHSYDLPVVLVKDDKTDYVFDISGINTFEYKSDRLFESVMDARDKIAAAIIETEKQEKQGTFLTNINVGKAIASEKDVSKEDEDRLMLRAIYNEVNRLRSIQKRENTLYHEKITFNDDLLILEELFIKLAKDLGRAPTYAEFRRVAREIVGSPTSISQFYSKRKLDFTLTSSFKKDLVSTSE